MSETIAVALLGIIGAICASVITGLFSILVALINNRKPGRKPDFSNLSAITFIGIALLSAFVGLVALVVTVLLSNSLLNSGNDNGTASQSAPTSAPNTAQLGFPQPTSLPATANLNNGSNCTSWEKCWEYDHANKTMTWIGPREGNISIGQAGESEKYILSGYTAIFTTNVPLKVCICEATLDDRYVRCSEQPIFIEPGTHTYYTQDTTGDTGGFGARSNFDVLCDNE